MKIKQVDKNSHTTQIPKRQAHIIEDADQVPEPGQVIRTKKSHIEGKVEKIGHNNDVFFRLADGRLMKAPIENVTVIEKLADEDEEIMEDDTALIARYKKAIGESRFEYDRKSGGMKQNHEDPDQRHGLYIDGKLIKTLSTKDQAESMKKHDPRFNSAEIKKIAEGGMGGINRCAPANDVSHQDDLNNVYDKWMGDTVKVKESGPYARMFNDLVEASFIDILNKQHAEKKAPVKVVPSKNPMFTIRYRAQKNLQPVDWQVLDKKQDIKHKGTSMSEKDAYNDAERWISSSRTVASAAEGSAMANFNAVATKRLETPGETLYISFWEGPILVYSTTRHQGFRPTSIKNSLANRGEGTTLIPALKMTADEVNAAGLKINARYKLSDDPIEIDPGVFGYELHFYGDVEPNQRVINRTEAIITINPMKDSVKETHIDEVSKSTLGSYIKKASRDVADRANRVGWQAGKSNPKYNTSDDTPKEEQRHRGIGKAVDRLSKQSPKQSPKSGYSKDNVDDVDYKDV